MKNKKGAKMNFSAIEAAIKPDTTIKIKLPKDATPKKTRVSKPRAAFETSVFAEGQDGNASVHKFVEENPFDNCNKLLSYYRDSIKNIYPNASFHNVQFERTKATEVMDMMVLAQKDNKIFLDAWISYYCNQKINENSAKDPERTSIKTFGKTFEEYTQKHISI